MIYETIEQMKPRIKSLPQTFDFEDGMRLIVSHYPKNLVHISCAVEEESPLESFGTVGSCEKLAVERIYQLFGSSFPLKASLSERNILHWLMTRRLYDYLVSQ